MVEKICDISSFKKGHGTIFQVAGKQIAVYFDGEEIFAFSPFCPHARANLTKGTFRKQEVKCHWHGWRFNLQDGEGLNNDARLKTYPVTVQNGEVFIGFQDEKEIKPAESEDLFMPEIKWKK